MGTPIDEDLLRKIWSELKNVEKLEFQSGLDSEGEPAAWVWVVFKARAPETAWSWNNREQIRSRVIEGLREAGVTDWVYVRFRNAGEETASTSARST